jgi:transcriptional regulator GlxA family with amidase domain
MSLVGNSTVATSVVSLFAGNLVGSATNKVMEIIEDRMDVTSRLGLSLPSKTLLDNALHLVLHVGVLGLGTELVTNAMPWLTEDTASFSMWLIGLVSTSGRLKRNLFALNASLFLPVEQKLPLIPPEKVLPPGAI